MTTPTPKTTIDRATYTIAFQRIFDAPRDEVFDAWTLPDQLAAWWDPTGVRLRECEIDARPGGKFNFVNDSGHSPPFTGVYRSVERPSELVFEAMGAVGTVRLEVDGLATRMTVTIRCLSLEHLSQYLERGVDVNTDRTMDNLVAHVAKRMPPLT